MSGLHVIKTGRPTSGDPQGETPNPRPSLCCTPISVGTGICDKKAHPDPRSQHLQLPGGGGESGAGSFRDNYVTHAGRAKVGSVVRMKIIQSLNNTTKTLCFVYAQL